MDAENWDAWLAELLRAHDIPGASLAVLHEDEVSTATAGVTNLDTHVDVTADTLFQIGSIAKAYTATAVMRLAERGELGLDAPVRDLLTGFKVADPVVTHRVTPRHLLSHTSGIAGECFEDTGRGGLPRPPLPATRSSATSPSARSSGRTCRSAARCRTATPATRSSGG
jgi:CubicO group peptidase (beta-lactamase class C family)